MKMTKMMVIASKPSSLKQNKLDNISQRERKLLHQLNLKMRKMKMIFYKMMMRMTMMMMKNLT
jgi:hypothetical protein